MATNMGEKLPVLDIGLLLFIFYSLIAAIYYGANIPFSSLGRFGQVIASLSQLGYSLIS
jgi:ABC-type multidrug transport system permease subunit